MQHPSRSLVRVRGAALAGLLSALALATPAAAQGEPLTIPPAGSSVPPADASTWVCPPTFDEAAETLVEKWCASADFGTPLPAFLRTPPPLSDLEAKNQYEKRLRDFLKLGGYRDLGWAHDEDWRMTGPMVAEIGALSEGTSYGSHLPVQVWYSPEVAEWLCNGREGELPDGAMVLKLMALHNDSLELEVDPEACPDELGQTVAIVNDPLVVAWLPMIKSSSASYDGWYYGGFVRLSPELYPEELIDPPVLDRSGITTELFYHATGNPPSEPNPAWYPTGFWVNDPQKFPDVIAPSNGYGGWCISCHASASSESIFSSADNIVGRALRYKLYAPDAGTPPPPGGGPHLLRLSDIAYSPYSPPHDEPSQAFLDLYDQLEPVSFADAWLERMPAQTYDHVVSGPDGPEGFLTSDQCVACHESVSYLGGYTNMALEETVDGQARRTNLSPFGEWSVSPMGLAGRDPIFYAQLQSETNHLPAQKECIENTCLHCHAVMGQRQLASDTPGEETPSCADFFGVDPPPGVPVGRSFGLDVLGQWPLSADNGEQRYAGLGRDGVSCMVCHTMSPEGLGEEAAATGNFVSGAPDEIVGPYREVLDLPMHNALGVTPRYGEQIERSALCGSCHDILLPVFTDTGTLATYRYEQTTHLEWQNSIYGQDGPEQRSCQDCHMPKAYKGAELEFRIANFESNQYPPTTHRAPDEEITPTLREEYSRHSLHGLNLFLNQMFSQFPLLLGYRQGAWYTRTTLGYPPLLLGAESMIDMARSQTATVEVGELEWTPEGKLSVPVTVRNLTGHSFPSGVGFRRAFLELVVRDEQGEALWASGRTNELGVLLVGTSDEPLPSEQPLANPDAPLQPHYFIVDAEDEVQIYQELVRDSEGALTFSFLRRFQEVKDNRIRPKGYDPAFFEGSDSPYVQELAETPGRAAFDPDYTDPALTGRDELEYLVTLPPELRAAADRVDLTLYYQSIPPAYLQERFADAGVGPGESSEIERLWYIASRLDVEAAKAPDGSPALKDWKLLVARGSRPVPPAR